jgi:hypothetical protein
MSRVGMGVIYNFTSMHPAPHSDDWSANSIIKNDMVRILPR